MQLSAPHSGTTIDQLKAPSALKQGRSLEAGPQSTQTPENGELREAFQDFVGQTFYSQMLSSMRKTVGKPAYFHGGQAEEVFRGQLDQVLAEKLSDATADQFAGPMYELFALGRK
jgi:peptidoglycan hydrolase FlgJ